jgi:hypothetical protein
MSMSTVRKEVVHPGHHEPSSAGSSATDEFERFFAEQFRPAPPPARPVIAPVPAAAPVEHAAAEAAPVAAAVHAPTPAPQTFEDPLMAELARIVGQQGVQRAVQRGADPVLEHVAAQPSKALDPLAAFEEELRRFDEMHRRAAEAAPAPEVVAVQATIAETQQAALPADHLTALEEELRRFDPAASQELRGTLPDAVAMPQGPEGLENEYQQPIPVLAVPDAPPPPPRSRRVVALLGTAAAVALVGVIGAVAMKSGNTPSGGKVPVIAANTQPMKEKPADPGGVEITGQDRQVLAKGTVEAAKPATMVNKEEQPVDLNQTPKREVSRVILPPSSGQGAQQATAAPIIMPSSPPPAPVAAPPQSAAPAQPTQAGGFEAKKVRSVRVGPEGDAAAGAPPAATPATAAPATTAPAAAVAAVVPPAAPKPAAATPATPPKAETRAAAVTPKSDARPATAVRAQTTTPQPQRQAARTAPAAAAEDDEEDAAENKPMSLRPPAGASPTRAVAKASATTPTTTASTGGSFSVQLAAAGSEAEARSAAASMKQKHSALAGYSPGWRTSEVNGRTVYRVRVSNLSRDKATQLCSQIKAGGGSCFVAGN